MLKNTKDLTLMKCYQGYGDLLAGYNVQKIYIDGANPPFIKGLKIQWRERSDYENVKKEHRQYMKVEPVNFNQEHREMLGQCKLYLEKGHIAINPMFDNIVLFTNTYMKTNI